jgi:hypothetical protein
MDLQLIHHRPDAEGCEGEWVYHVLAACEVRDALEQLLPLRGVDDGDLQKADDTERRS